LTKSIYEPTIYRDVAANRWGVQDLRQKPLAMAWWTPDCDPGDPDQAAASCTGLEPPLVNNFAQPDPQLEFFAFRIHADGSLEFKGHLDISAASSGDVAFTLPGINPGEVDFIPPNDQYFFTIVTDGGSLFQAAMVFIDSTSGDVTITWPIS